MRRLPRVSVLLLVWQFTTALLLILMAGSAPARAEDNSESQSHQTDDGIFEWCMSYFPRVDEENGTTTRPAGNLAPFKLEEMIAPADLITKTEIAGKLPGYIRKYRGVWIWPMITEPPLFALFVERLSPREMTIALLSRATADNRPHRKRLLENSREKLTWNGTAFSSEPEGELQSKTTIYISAFGHAMLVVYENNREAWPMCLISSKHY
jgi:hypothetical protein